MSNRTRVFSRDELEAMGVPHFPASSKAVKLHQEEIEQRRWVSVQHLVFRAPDDGRIWRVEYLEGLTEHQDDTDPWDYESEVSADEVHPFQVFHTMWMTLNEASLYPHPLEPGSGYQRKDA